MNRAMFSGVAGMKTHQTKMDVIGNNIANVNTYGFKSQRAVFSDIYYQSLRGATEGSSARGGTNPSSVGYGSTLAAVQTQMTSSSMQNTGFGLDVAIMGEGYLQVMDPDGNIFYTKAGLLDYDSNGYLTDINGNFVLGAATADGDPDSQKIKLDNIGSVDAKSPSVTKKINGVEYTITSSNTSKYGNVGLSLASSRNLPAGLKAAATISSTGAISVQLNEYEEFNSMSELNKAINEAIKEANGGKEHAAGTFTITADKNLFGKDAVTGSFTGEACAEPLTFVGDKDFFNGKLKIGEFNPNVPVSGQGGIDFKVAKDATSGKYTISTEINGVTYESAEIDPAAISQPPITLTTKNAGGGSIELVANGSAALDATDFVDGAVSKATITKANCFLGGAKITGVSSNLPVGGGIGFSIVTDSVQATGEYEISAKVGSKTYTGTVDPNGGVVKLVTTGPDANPAVDGEITVQFPTLDELKKNLGLPNNPTPQDIEKALKDSVGSHSYNIIAHKPAVNTPLTGAQIVGENFGTIPGKITGAPAENGFFGGGMKIMGTSSNFSSSGTVNPTDFIAAYTEAKGTDPAFWEISMEIDGKTYSAKLDENTKGKSLLLKSGDEYIQVSNPGFAAMKETFEDQNPPGTVLGDGAKIQAYTETDTLTVKAAEKSKDLGLSSTSFALTGGTEGGSITLDELASVSIGSDGTVSVSHAEKGVVVAGKISLANFSNPRGLQLEGSNYFSATVNSGEPRLCDPGSDGSGSLKNSALEMSNVDLSSEMADMITTQRGFQANSRIITVSDAMLEELINLKR